MKQKKSASILRKFLLFNLAVFSVLGLFTIFYLKAIQPNLVKKRAANHYIIIENTVDHLKRLKIQFTAEEIKTFLLSTRFLFQSLDRVQFFSIDGNLVGDTNILDLDQNVFTRSEIIIEETIDGKVREKNNSNKILKNQDKSLVKKILKNKSNNEPSTISEVTQNNFYVRTIDKIIIADKEVGYIVVSEEANDIINAVKERKDFIIRTVLAVALVILIFSLFLNKYILKPIGLLVSFSEAIKKKSSKSIDIKNFFVREDEIGKLTKSIDEMTKELQKRTARAETFSNDLAHEIRNPLASLKSASEILQDTSDNEQRSRLLNILSHDVQRIERLITDYSQMLKDEVALSKEKMKKINVEPVVQSVVDDYNNIHQVKHGIKIEYKNDGRDKYIINGIENRIEQIIANLLDNSISFSKKGSNVFVNVSRSEKNQISIKIIDEGQGFKEKDTSRIFKRFYSNRPEKFGEHSGLGLNIVKNLVDLHDGEIVATNRSDKEGAMIEILFPSV